MRVAFVSYVPPCLGMLFCLLLHAQSISVPSGSKGPQAKSGAELDAFGLLYEAHTPKDSAAAAESFLRSYPDSEFVEYAAIAAMHSHHDMGSWKRSKELAELVLKIDPDNVDALLHLARLLIDPEHEDKGNLGEAGRLAERGLTKLKTMSIPRSANSRDWLRTRNSFTAIGSSVRGWVCFRTGAKDRAIDYLKEAARLDPQGEYFYRLSLVAEAKRDVKGSRDWASQAIQAGPEWIGVLARRQLAALEASCDDR
ncbi:MAG: tetratricopeptide repeat protein [Bryobacteraceae bacterium]